MGHFKSFLLLLFFSTSVQAMQQANDPAKMLKTPLSRSIYFYLDADEKDDYEGSEIWEDLINKYLDEGQKLKPEELHIIAKPLFNICESVGTSQYELAEKLMFYCPIDSSIQLTRIKSLKELAIKAITKNSNLLCFSDPSHVVLKNSSEYLALGKTILYQGKKNKEIKIPQELMIVLIEKCPVLRTKFCDVMLVNPKSEDEKTRNHRCIALAAQCNSRTLTAIVNCLEDQKIDTARSLNKVLQGKYLQNISYFLETLLTQISKEERELAVSMLKQSDIFQAIELLPIYNAIYKLFDSKYTTQECAQFIFEHKLKNVSKAIDESTKITGWNNANRSNCTIS